MANRHQFANAKPFQVVALLVEEAYLRYVIDPSDVVDMMYSEAGPA